MFPPKLLTLQHLSVNEDNWVLLRVSQKTIITVCHRKSAIFGWCSARLRARTHRYRQTQRHVYRLQSHSGTCNNKYRTHKHRQVIIIIVKISTYSRNHGHNRNRSTRARAHKYTLTHRGIRRRQHVVGALLVAHRETLQLAYMMCCAQFSNWKDVVRQCNQQPNPVRLTLNIGTTTGFQL